MEKIILNSLIKSSKNRYLWFNILSATKEKKKIPKKVFNKLLKKQTTEYFEADDFLIEYKIVFDTVNGNKIKNDLFTYHSFLTDFQTREQNFITQLIKIRNSVKESADTKTAIAKVTII